MKKPFLFPLAALVLGACSEVAPPVAPKLDPPLRFEAAAAPVTLASWDFNTPSGGGWSATVTAGSGNGTLTHNFISTTDFAGTSLNADPGTEAGRDFAVTAGMGVGNNGKEFILAVPTVGYEQIELSYATRRSSTGFTSQEVAYSVDGGASFQPHETVTPLTTTTTGWLSGSVVTVDFSSVAGTADNADFQVRVRISGATHSSGNNRWDNIKVRGVALPPPPANQTIEFDPLEHRIYGDDPFTVSATASSGLPVRFEAAGGVCTVSGELVTVTGAGTCTLTAIQDGNQGFAPATMSRSFNIVPWTLVGFLAPIDMSAEVFNTIKGGSTVPLKFRVYAGDREITSTSGVSVMVGTLGSCDATEVPENPLPPTDAGATSLRYSTDQFIQNWKTPNTVNVCYSVTARAGGGSTTALFSTRK